MAALHPIVLVLCWYGKDGNGREYREGDRICLFTSVAAWKEWVQDLPLPNKFYAYPLRNLAAQLVHLKIFRKDGITAVLYPDGRTLPIDDLISQIQAAVTPEGSP